MGGEKKEGSKEGGRERREELSLPVSRDNQTTSPSVTSPTKRLFTHPPAPASNAHFRVIDPELVPSFEYKKIGAERRKGEERGIFRHGGMERSLCASQELSSLMQWVSRRLTR